ncbi:DNA (cytosine-5)-methyltransferase 1 [Paenibacillus sp. BK033]|nr:DNA (cytosine-5)-methyltransferase 1 [Paenibacillus sp. BK033]
MLYDATPQQPSNGFTAAELFAGGGLMAVGLKTAGYNLVWANDFEKKQCEAYRHNIGDHIVHGDITKIKARDIPNTDIIAGGPPCQDYSVAGQGAGEKGSRGRLVFRYLAIIKVKQPKAFVFENVKGLIGKNHKKTFEKLLRRFKRIGYNVSYRVVMAWDYGVAQKRERVFIVGIRKDLKFEFQFPEPMDGDYRTQVLRDAIGDLPEPNDGTNAHIQTQATTVKENQNLSFQRSYTADWGKPGWTVNCSRLDHAEIHPGPENHDPEVSLPKYIQNVVDGKTTTNYGTGIPVNDGSVPAKTLIAQYRAKCPNEVTSVNHYRPRRFTVRECLRIQSVPDWYCFPETISLSKMYEIVGNGVASRVAWYLGKALAEQLRDALEKRSKQQSSTVFPVAFKIKPKVVEQIACDL